MLSNTSSDYGYSRNLKFIQYMIIRRMHTVEVQHESE